MEPVWTNVLKSCRSGRHQRTTKLPQQKGSREKNLLIESIDKLEKSPHAITPLAYSSLLKQCIAHGAIAHGERVHAHIAANAPPGTVAATPLIGNLLVQLYARGGHLARAREIFNSLLARGIFAWTSLMGSYVRAARFRDALDLFAELERDPRVAPDTFVYTIALAACSSLGDLELGRAIHAAAGTTHANASTRDLVLNTAILNMYAKCGSVAEARLVFDSMEERDPVAWNAMIAGYAQNGHTTDAIILYRAMAAEGMEASEGTFVAILGVCSSLLLVRSIHARFLASAIRSSDVITSLVSAYARCRSLDDARRVFDAAREKTLFLWTALITAYAHHGRHREALDLFERSCVSVEPDCHTLSIALMAAASAGDLATGVAIHARIEARPEEDDEDDRQGSVMGALVNMYAKCGRLEEARRVFDGWIARKNKGVIVWNAMLAGYVQHGRGDEALQLYARMIESEAEEPSAFTFSIALGACAGGEDLDRGRWMHAHIRARSGMELDAAVLNSIVRMYAMCGSLRDAMAAFDRGVQRGVAEAASWNAIIVALARFGRARDAIQIYYGMSVEGLEPSAVTLSAVLTACGHTGETEELFTLFVIVVGDCGVIPALEQYECVADVLGRSGRLRDAADLLRAMPLYPAAAPWRSLLGACRVHGSAAAEEIARVAAEEIVAIEPYDHTAYVMLSNVYTSEDHELPAITKSGID